MIPSRARTFACFALGFLLVAVIASYGFTYYILSAHPKRVSEFLQKKAQALSINASIGRITPISPFKLSLDRIIGNRGPYKFEMNQVTIELSLANIFFGQSPIESIDAESIRAFAIWDDIEEPRGKNGFNQRPGSPQFQLSRQFLSQLPNLGIGKWQLTVHDINHYPIFKVAGLQSSYKKSDQTLSLNQASLAYRNVQLLEGIHGQFLLNNPDRDIKFLFQGQPQASQQFLLRGAFDLKSRRIHILTKNRGFLATLAQHLGVTLPNNHDINSALKLDLQIAQQGAIKFDMQAASTNLQFYHQKLSHHTVGPLPVFLKLKGMFRLVSGALEGRGFVRFTAVRNKKYSSHLNFSFRTKDILDRSDNAPWLINFSLPRTSCETIQRTIPLGFMNEIKTFNITGNAAFSANLSLTLNKPENFSLNILKAQYHCHLSSRLYRYSQEFFNEPEFIKGPGEELRGQLRAFKALSSQLPPVNPHFLAAVVASEDSGYWTHSGIEWSAVEQAMRANLKEKRFVYGGSTISMQFVKNLYLWDYGRTIDRKLQEFILTPYIESILNKQKLLALYAGIIEFGPDLYGLEQASQVFFRKPQRQLSFNEAIYLASILPNPKEAVFNICERRLREPWSERFAALRQRVLEQGSPGTKDTVETQNETWPHFRPYETYVRKHCPLVIARP